MKTIKFAFSYNVKTGSVDEISYKEWQLAQNIIKSYNEIDIGYGGMIVFSTDVNSNASGGIKGKIKSFIKTWWNRLTRRNKIDKDVLEEVKKKGISTGWSIGNLFNGRYFDQSNGDLFNEKSLCIDLRGADMKFVKDIADKFRKTFDQQSVLVINHKTGKSSLIME
jgi:hypothetical protein